MRLSIILLAAMIAAECALPASAQVSAVHASAVRISADPGGQIGPYLDKLKSLRDSGQSVIIDGPCLSACTMVLGMIPRDRICVTHRARLGFHAAWRPDQNGHQIVSEDGTELLMSVYPQDVRDWISRRGGLSPQLKYLSGGELASMYPACGAGGSSAADRGSGREHVAQGLHPGKARATSVSAAARIQ
jgi:hypothetical protein